MRILLSRPLAGLLLASLCCSTLSQAHAYQKVRDGQVSYPGGYVLEVGEFGVLPPPLSSAGTASEVLILNGPELPGDGGGAQQRLMGLAAGAGGFAAAWSDSRDGSLGMFLGLLDAGGETPLDGAPVHFPRSSRQMLPDIALVPGAADGKLVGGAAWSGQEMRGRIAKLRFFETPAEPPAPGALRASQAALLDQPMQLAPLKNTSGVELELTAEAGLVAWATDGFLGGYALRRDSETGRFTRGAQVILCRNARPTGGAFEMALGPRAKALAAWAEAGEEGLTMYVAARDLYSKEPGVPQALGTARPLGLAPDASGGFWLLFTRDAHAVLLHLDEDGTPTADMTPTIVSTVPAMDAKLTTWGDGVGVAVLIEERAREEAPETLAGRSHGGPIQLHIFGPGAKRLTPPAGFDALDADAKDARDAHVAALGTRFLVAWTDSREDDADVYFRLIELADPLRPARRWNQDQGAADQVHAALATVGDTALVVWEDTRRGAPEIFTRALSLTAEEQLELGREGPLQTRPTGTQAFPHVMLNTEGQALVTWKEDLGGGWVLRGQVVEADGTPKGEAFDLDRGHQAARTFAAAGLALPGDAGFLVAWVRQDPGPEQGPVARRFSATGAPLGQAQSLGRAKDARNLDLAEGRDGRILVVWDQLGLTPARVPGQPAPKAKEARVITGRFVDPGGSPLEKPLVFPPSPDGGDLEPSISPLLTGGYVLAWTGNDGPSRDVFARLLDGSGRPEGPPLSMSVRANEQDYPETLELEDGRLLVAWEDDISGDDHGFLRSISFVRGTAGQRAELGPRLLINETESVFVVNRHAPLIARLGSGVLLVWGDLARGLGHDVAARFAKLD